MVASPKIRSFRFLALAALIVSLAATNAASAQKGKKPPPPPPPPKKTVELEPARQERHLEEAAVLLQAYVLLAGANATYEGYRGKAMKEVANAFNQLGRQVLEKGTPKQKALALELSKNLRAAQLAAGNAPSVHEDQLVSDAQMDQAKTQLIKLRDVLAKHKQKGILDKVNGAVGQIEAALKVN